MTRKRGTFATTMIVASVMLWSVASAAATSALANDPIIFMSSDEPLIKTFLGLGPVGPVGDKGGKGLRTGSGLSLARIALSVRMRGENA